MALSTKSASVMAVVALLIVSFCAILPGSDGTEDFTASDTYPEGSVTITTNDSQGTITQTYTEIPDRIIVGNVTCLEMLLYFGLGDRIVGIYYLEDEVWSELDNEFADVIESLAGDGDVSTNMRTSCLKLCIFFLKKTDFAGSTILPSESLITVSAPCEIDATTIIIKNKILIILLNFPHQRFHHIQPALRPKISNSRRRISSLLSSRIRPKRSRF